MVRSSPTSCPHSAGATIVTRQHSWKRRSPNLEIKNVASLPFSKKASLSTRLLCAQLIKAATQSQPQPVRRTFCSSLLLGHKLVTSVWKFLWVFLSIAFLRNPRTPVLVTLPGSIPIPALSGLFTPRFSSVSRVSGSGPPLGPCQSHTGP